MPFSVNDRHPMPYYAQEHRIPGQTPGMRCFFFSVIGIYDYFIVWFQAYGNVFMMIISSAITKP